TVNRSEETSIPTSVDVILNSGSALAGTDFAAEPITVNFAAGETSKTILITILGERLVEDNETLQLSLGNFTDYGFAGAINPTATLTLINDEFAPVADAGGPYTVEEYGTILLDAAGSSDHEDPISALTFEWDLSFDGVTFDVNAVGVQTQFRTYDGPGSRDVAVRVTDTEGNSTIASTTISTINVAPQIGPQADEAFEVYEWANLNREITFVDPGLGDLHSFTVNYGDGSPEQTFSLPRYERSFDLQHSYPVTTGGTSYYTVTILGSDDDSGTASETFSVAVTDKAINTPDTRPTINILAPAYTVGEGYPYPSWTRVTASLTSPAPETMEIPWILKDEIATLDSDYILNDTKFVFRAGSSVAEITLFALDDTLLEPSTETVTLAIDPLVEKVKLGSRVETVLQVRDSGDSAPEYYFKEFGASVREGSRYQVLLELTKAYGVDLTIPILLDSNTSDYYLSEPSVFIPAGARSGYVWLHIVDDTLSEPVESLTLNLPSQIQDATTNTTLNRSRWSTNFTASVDPSDAILVSLATPSNNVSESDGQFDITVNLNDGVVAPTDLFFPLTFSSSTASDPDDYQGISSITIPAGQTSATASVPITDDVFAEGPESVYVRFGDNLPDGVQAARDGRSTKVTIDDDDATTIQFTSRRTSVYEDAGQFQIEVSLKGSAFAEDVDVPFSVKELSASGHYNGTSADLTGPTGTIRIPAGTKTGSIVVNPVNDTATPKREGKEYFDFILGALDDIPGAQSGATTTHTVTILDDDPEASISVAETSVSEGATTSIKFTVKLTAATNKKVRIPFDVFGLAKRDDDYKIIEETPTNYKVSRNFVEINAGKTTAIIQVQMINDNISEVAERMGIKLVPKYGTLLLTNALIGGTNADSFVIKGSDGVPVPTISVVRGKQPGSSSYSSTSSWINEGGSFRVTVSLANPASKNVYVPISFPGASGRASSDDFTTGSLSGGKLKIPAGKTSANFYIYTTQDTTPEENEKIRITMGQPVDSSGRNYGKLPATYYKFVGINASDPWTATATPGTVQVTDGTIGTYPAPTGGSSPTPTVDSPPITGTGFIGLTLNGYREGSIVFLDGNLNGIHDYLDFNGDGIQSENEPTEPLATTFADGSFLIDVPEEFDKNANGILDLNEAQIVSIGGTDTSTGLTQETRLVAAPGDYVTTPLTTLAAKLVQQYGFTLDDAHSRVLESMRLPNFEMGKVSALTATMEGDVSAAASIPATNALNNTAVVIANYLSGVSQVSVETWADLVYRQTGSIVSQLNATIDLADAVFLENLIADTAAQLGLDEFNAQTTAVSEALAAINAEMLILPVSTDLAFLEAIVQRKIVARGDMSVDARAMGDSSLTAVEFAARYSGQALQDRIAATQPGTIEPVRIGISDAQIVEGDDGITYAEFELLISDYFTTSISVQYATEDDSAVSGVAESGADYQSVSGTLTWNPGDAVSKTISIPVHGDTVPELDELFRVVLSDPSSGIIQRAIGRGVIRSDDAMTIPLNSAADVTEVSIIVEDRAVLISQDGIILLDGELSSTAPLQILTAADSETHVTVSFSSTDSGTRDLTVTSQGTNDSLFLNNELANTTLHEVLSPTSGRVEQDDSILEYSGFSTVTTDKSPSMSLGSEPTIGEDLQVSVQFPEQANTDDAVLTWTLLRDGVSVATATGDTAVFHPVTDGSFVIRLDAELLDGSLSSVQQSFELLPLNAPPVANAGGPYQVSEGGTLQLSGAESSDPDLPDDILHFEWDLDGDGIFGETGADAARGDESGATPVFDAGSLDGPDSHVVQLRVTDSYGETDISETTISVVNVAPVPVIEQISDSRLEGSEIVVTGAATDPAGSGDTLAYDYRVYKNGAETVFASASGTDLLSFTFTPDDNGSYQIVLTVSDEDGGTASVSETITVSNVAPAIHELTSSHPELESRSSDGLVTLHGRLIDPALNHDFYTVAVNWGDGTTEMLPASAVLQSAQSFVHSHQYANGGIYTISVTVFDEDQGVSLTATSSSVVEGV
ncbi:MAG: hypothetical protein KDA91_20815, partial [Planctomycetaceae bacterium]|nr:hypothetical protein [Planctomycetaceae bacterium]